MPAPLDPIEKLGRENERLRIDNANLRSMNKKILRRGVMGDDLLEELRDVLDHEKEFSYNPSAGYKILDPVDQDHSEIAALCVSDWHLTETVRHEDANGINVYNSMIAANRVWQIAQAAKSIISRHRSMYDIEKLWTPLLGDMINGSIHAELVLTNDLTDPAAVILCSRLLYMFYQELATLDLPIEIDAIHGNHPRLTPKMPTKRQAHTNLDWMIYEILADHLKKDDQFSMTVHTSQIGMKQLYGHNYVFEHGISVANGAEGAFEDRIRAMFDDPVYRKATGYKGASFDQLVIGNLHVPKFLERTIVNGSLTGQNELGMSWRLKPIKAHQLMWGISPGHVRTWQYNLDVTDVKTEKVTNPFSDYTRWFLKKHSK